MAYWEPVTHDDLIILTEWMAQAGYSAAQLAEAVREPARYDEELRTLVRRNATIAGTMLDGEKDHQQQVAAEFLAARAAKHSDQALALLLRKVDGETQL